jgi:hypothetical protein
MRARRACTGLVLRQPTATDSCGGTVTLMNNATAKDALGMTTVTWTATDARGNMSTATQRVTVLLGDDATGCPAGTHVIRGTPNNDMLNGTGGSDSRSSSGLRLRTQHASRSLSLQDSVSARPIAP